MPIIGEKKSYDKKKSTCYDNNQMKQSTHQKSGIYNTDKIIGVKINKMSIPQEASNITIKLTNQFK